MLKNDTVSRTQHDGGSTHICIQSMSNTTHMHVAHICTQACTLTTFMEKDVWVYNCPGFHHSVYVLYSKCFQRLKNRAVLNPFKVES